MQQLRLCGQWSSCSCRTTAASDTCKCSSVLYTTMRTISTKYICKRQTYTLCNKHINISEKDIYHPRRNVKKTCAIWYIQTFLDLHLATSPSLDQIRWEHKGLVNLYSANVWTTPSRSFHVASLDQSGKPSRNLWWFCSIRLQWKKKHESLVI